VNFSDKVKERVKPIAALNDDELFALFNMYDARFRQLHAMLKASEPDLMDNAMTSERVRFFNMEEEAALITRACAELIRQRVKTAKRKGMK
jgi:hypothetical protein